MHGVLTHSSMKLFWVKQMKDPWVESHPVYVSIGLKNSMKVGVQEFRVHLRDRSVLFDPEKSKDRTVNGSMSTLMHFHLKF